MKLHSYRNEQRLVFVASIVLLVLTLALFTVPYGDASARRFLAGSVGKVAVFFFVLSAAWIPIRRMWNKPWGKSIAIGLLVCIVVAAFRPRALFAVVPVVVAATGFYGAISSWSRLFRQD